MVKYVPSFCTSPLQGPLISPDLPCSAECHAMPVPCNSAAKVSTEAWTSDFQKPRPQVQLWFPSVG